MRFGFGKVLLNFVHFVSDNNKSYSPVDMLIRDSWACSSLSASVPVIQRQIVNSVRVGRPLW